MSETSPRVEYRIENSTFVAMIAVAALFDLAQLATKILYFTTLAVVGAAAGAAAGDTIGAAGAGATVGGAVGAVLMFTGIGTAVGLGVGMLLAETLSWLILMIGMFSMWLWLRLKGVPILEGDQLASKFLTFALAVVVEFVPMLNAAPAITLWTIRMVLLSRLEDTKKASGAKMAIPVRRAPRRARREETGDVGGHLAYEY